jgi:hypothetical protein
LDGMPNFFFMKCLQLWPVGHCGPSYISSSWMTN